MYEPLLYPRPNPAIAETVFGQLLDDYPAEAIDWVRAAHWVGPEEVDIECIDFSNSGAWAATDEPEKVESFVEDIQSGYKKPIVLVDEPTDGKLIVIDGHHRLLAYQRLGINPIAYVACVGASMGPWLDMHSQEINGQSYK